MSDGHPTVLHVLEALAGGAARHLTDLVRHSTQARHEVVLPTQRFGDATDTAAIERLRDAGASVHVVDMRRSPAHPDNALALAKLVRLIRNRTPDVVHGHASIGGALVRAANRVSARVPSVFTPHRVLESRVVVRAERQLSRLTTKVIAVSVGQRDLLIDQRVARADQIVMIPNGIDPTPTAASERIDLRARAGIPADAPVVGMLCRLAAPKAPIGFVEVCRILAAERSDAHFVLIGDGPLAKDVDAALRQWPEPHRFHRLSHVPDAGRALGSLDVFVLLSGREGGPYAPLEAMREGVPVVLSDVIGNRDTVLDGETGFLVGLHDHAAAAERALELLTQPELRDKIAANAESRLRQVFSAAAMGSAYDALYAELRDSRSH